MSDQRDPDVVVAAWIDEGPVDLPEDQRRAIVNATQLLPQRRGGIAGPWRDSAMTGTLRIALGAVAVIAIALAGLVVLGPGLSGGTGAPPSPTPTPEPTPEADGAVLMGTISLTDRGCRKVGFDDNLTPMNYPLAVQFRNETQTFANFGFYLLREGRTWQEAVEYIATVDAALETGAEWPPMDFAVEAGNIDVEAGAAPGRLVIPLDQTPGTYGFLCSANEPPPGKIFSVYLVGPIEIG